VVYTDVNSMMVNAKVLTDIVVKVLMTRSLVMSNYVTEMRRLYDEAAHLVAAVHQLYLCFNIYPATHT